jgi:protein-disulfide isomerase
MTRVIALLAVVLAGVTLFIALPAPDAPDLAPRQREQMQEIVREYLREHPEAVVDALLTMQQREQQAQEDRRKLTLATSQVELYAAPEDASLGNPKARTLIVEFYDYRCTYCRGIAANVRKLVEEDKDLRIVLKELPILGPESIYAARASLAASGHARFAEFHSALMAALGPLNDASVSRIAGAVGIDFAALKKRMETPEVQAAIDRNLALARSLGINGTPAFVIGASVYPGALENEIIKRLVSQLRAAG